MFTEFVPALTAILGTAVGGFVTYKVQTSIEKTKVEQRKKALTAALYGEIHSLLHLAEIRNYLGMIINVVSFIQKNKNYPAHEHFFTMQLQDYFDIYHNNSQFIGEIDSDVAPKISSFYVNVFSLLEDMLTQPGEAYRLAQTAYGATPLANQLYIDNLYSGLINDMRLFCQSIHIGQEICETLSKRYSYKYEPVFDNIAQLEAQIDEFKDLKWK